MRSGILIVLGAIVLALGLWWLSALSFSIASILAALVIGLGGALIVAGIAVAFDMFDPTSKKI